MLCSDGILIILRDGVLGSASGRLASASSLVTVGCRNVDDVPADVPASAAVANDDAMDVNSVLHIKKKSNIKSSKDDGDLSSACDSASNSDSDSGNFVVMDSPSTSTSLSTSISLTPFVITNGTDDFLNISMVENSISSSSSTSSSSLSHALTQIPLAIHPVKAAVDNTIQRIYTEDILGQGEERDERERQISHTISYFPTNNSNWPQNVRVNVGRNFPQNNEIEGQSRVKSRDFEEGQNDEISPAIQMLQLGSWLVKITKVELAVDIENTEYVENRGNAENSQIQNSALLLKKSDNRENCKSRIRVLQSVKDIFPGQFHYYLKVPAYCCELVVLSDQTNGGNMQLRGQKVLQSTGASSKDKNTEVVVGSKEGGNGMELESKLESDQIEQQKQKQKQQQQQLYQQQHEVEGWREETSLESPALNGIDLRLKAGLPLLVPIAFKDDVILHSNVNMLQNNGNEYLLFLEYSFVRTNPDCVPSV